MRFAGRNKKRNGTTNNYFVDFYAEMNTVEINATEMKTIEMNAAELDIVQ